MISLHTSPQDQPGTGDAGGMNVYVLEVAKRLADQGVSVDVFTRCHGDDHPKVQRIADHSRLIQVQAGPCAHVAKEHLPRLLPGFLDGVLEFAAAEPEDAHPHGPYDVVHSHYWLSGWVGARAKEIWGAPLVTSFHTLGKVKNAFKGPDDQPEPAARLRGEHGVIRHSDRILAPTSSEVANLVGLYGADPGRISIVPPGVDRSLFVPRDGDAARARLDLGPGPIVLFVGRLQPFKGPQVAIQAFARVATRPSVPGTATLVIVGGPSGGGAAELNRLAAEASALGVGPRVRFVPPQPHARLAEFYSAADVVVVPSRSESFGLVALEAQACGRPVVAAAVGGLRHSIVDGVTGFLVPGHDPEAFADQMAELLEHPHLKRRMGLAAAEHAGRFTWDATAAEIGRVYREVAHPKAGVA
ncbi:MAG TPA: D-inositol-3-phosphate glycosyltransferase [Actinomycetota bacterium]|nr:D-inositol-3-phosphate glycosyltransferase [Actinomycetota bacterium]